MGFLSGSKTEMVSPDEALDGRGEALPSIPEGHHVLDAPLAEPADGDLEEAFFAMGCFWGAERLYWQTDGVISTAVGYMGGFTPNPTYEEVCSGGTGHAEAVRVVFDPGRVSYEELLKVFWENHDPTQGMRQGNDVGTQYRSAIYTTTDAQRRQAKRSRERYQRALEQSGLGGITTEIRPATDAGSFYYAEDHHQQYLAKNPRGYCNHGFCQVGYDMDAAASTADMDAAASTADSDAADADRSTGTD